MAKFEEKQLTGGLQYRRVRYQSGPNPFDVKVDLVLQQEWRITTGGEGNGVNVEYVWLDVPIVNAE